MNKLIDWTSSDRDLYQFIKFSMKIATHEWLILIFTKWEKEEKEGEQL